MDVLEPVREEVVGAFDPIDSLRLAQRDVELFHGFARSVDIFGSLDN